MREMKDSGIEWIGEVPADWRIVHLKYLCLFKTGGTPSNKVGINVDEEGIPWITPEDITDKIDIRSGRQFISLSALSDNNYVAFPIGSTLLVCIASVGKVGALNFEAYANQQITALKPTEKIQDKRFLTYVIKAASGQISFDASSNVVPIVNTKYLSNFSVCLPNGDVQQSISTYLDAKCAEIDALTADIQSQIDTLEQYKRSVITEAVTMGLDKDVEMKDSGIDGAGLSPSHWKTTRLCYECYIRARLGWRGLKADEYVDEGYAFISAFNIQNGKLVWTPLNYITKERFDESPEIKLHSGDVLIVKDGAGVGKCARVDDLPMGGTAPNSSIAVITPSKNMDYRYVCYYLQSAVFNNFVLLLYNGMGVPHLTQEVMSKIKILVPSLKEQMVISDYLDAKCTEIDAVVETKKSQLATLDEYKESLIFEYVTGKKEVPDV